MRHCSSCVRCKRDPFTKYLKDEIWECKLDGHLVVFPFFEGFGCKYYKKETSIFRDFFKDKNGL